MKEAPPTAETRRSQAKPRVLILSQHAPFADGLVRLLSLDGRYEVRRSPTVSDVADGWRADVVLVDGSVLRNAPPLVPLPAPAIVLAGTREDAEQILPRLPSAKGWLRKDATFPEFESALARAGVTAPPALTRSGVPTLVVAIFGAVLLLAAIAAVWLALH
jgi:hypothetical protein